MASPPRRSRRRYAAAVAGLVVLVVLGAAAIALVSSRASLSGDSRALAQLGMPLGGGSVQSLIAVTGPHSRRLPVSIRDGRIWPLSRVRAGARIDVELVIRRPGWISWLAGHTERLTLTVVAPTAAPAQDYLTLGRSEPLTIHFTHPVSAVAYGPAAGRLTRRTLPGPSTQVTLPRSAQAGAVWVAAMARNWEIAPAHPVSWFPAGAATSAVASPAPGTTIKPQTPITLTFSKPVSQALGRSMPPVSPSTPGTWHAVDAHTIVFRPEGYGYGLGAHVIVGLPSGVRLVGGQAAGSSENASWSVPAGTTLRLQQLLANLGYLPLSFRYARAPVAPTATAQENAALSPPTGSFSWRYPNTPAALRGLWAPGSYGEMTKGAIMAFQNTQGLAADGIPGPQLWKALIAAALHGQVNAFGYTFVQVSEASPETESTWHNGRTVASGVVNTGIPAAPTAKGVFAVFEHAPSVTMSGTNPDGSHYSDPGVPYVSYFNGGDALHGFRRASYGSAQSLGCVEMPYDEAAAVYKYTPIGTLVEVA